MSKNGQGIRLRSHCSCEWPESDFFAHMWPSSDLLSTVWTAQVALNLTFSNQNQATFKCGTESDTHLIFLNATAVWTARLDGSFITNIIISVVFSAALLRLCSDGRRAFSCRFHSNSGAPEKFILYFFFSVKITVCGVWTWELVEMRVSRSLRETWEPWLLALSHTVLQYRLPLPWSLL